MFKWTTPFLELRSSIAVKAGKDFLNTWNCQTAGDIGVAEKCRKSVFFYLVCKTDIISEIVRFPSTRYS